MANLSPLNTQYKALSTARIGPNAVKKDEEIVFCSSSSTPSYPCPPPPPPSVPRPQGYTAAYCHCTDGAAVRCAPSQRYLTAASGRGRQRTCASLVLLRVNSVRVKRGHEGAFQGLTSRAQRRSRGRLLGLRLPSRSGFVSGRRGNPLRERQGRGPEPRPSRAPTSPGTRRSGRKVTRKGEGKGQARGGVTRAELAKTRQESDKYQKRKKKKEKWERNPTEKLESGRHLHPAEIGPTKRGQE